MSLTGKIGVMFETPEENKTSLESYGYEVIEDHERLTAGMRVCHRGQLYSEAQEDGTAEIVYVLEHKKSPWSTKYHQRDIEVVVKRDDGTIGQWQDYGTRVAYNQPEKENADV